MRKLGLLAVVLAMAVSAGCEDEVTGGDGTGRLRINLTDAPGDLQEAFVKIGEIVLLIDDGERVVIEPTITGFIDLLDLTNGRVMEIADAGNLPEGAYSELRIVIEDAYVQLNDGRIFATSGAELPAGEEADGTLRCPSCAQSGFKVKFPEDEDGLNINGTTWVTIDFDAAQSFGHQAGNSGQWIMRPVLRAVATNHEYSQISGTVAFAAGVTPPTCGGAPTTVQVFRPLATIGTETLSAVVNAQGTYQLGTLMPGTYTMGYANELSFTNGDSLTVVATPTPASVTLAEGDSVVANYSITAATCH